MSPDAFGRTPRQAVVGALLLTVLGVGVVLYLDRLLTRPTSPLAIAFGSLGLPPWLIPAIGCAAVAALAMLGYTRSVRQAERFRITPDGLEVQGPFGAYTLAWGNVAEARVTASKALGIRVRQRDAVLATHAGTDQQREWLRTMEPFGEWDFLYSRAELGVPAATVLEWLRPHLTDAA